MIPNHSPWIKQLKRTRPVVSLKENVNTEVAIIGGGIAGVVTAFFVLRDTSKAVVLVEADKIAHGATGHNAGQLTSYFERPLYDLVKEFGLELATDGQKSVESAWTLVDQIVTEAKLQTPLYRFTGYAGVSSFDQLLIHLKNNRCRVQGGLLAESIMVSEEWSTINKLPEEYKDLYTTAKQNDLLDLLQTNNSDYIAVISSQKGCMNSALFSEELIGYLIATHKDRFSFYEGSPVKTIYLFEKKATLEILENKITTSNVVLCTNGFENFKIVNDFGPEIDTAFHHLVMGRIGYMSGYLEPINHSPIAISYLPRIDKSLIRGQDNDPTGESYFYLTRRPHEHEGSNSHNLICTGGPDKILPEGVAYLRENLFSEKIKIVIDEFLRNNYAKYPNQEAEYSFYWHGLMGYTPNGIRRVGPEPCNPVLLYNLGCNGIGILPSIFGGKRISQFLNGENIGRSIFDPQSQPVK